MVAMEGSYLIGVSSGCIFESVRCICKRIPSELLMGTC